MLNLQEKQSHYLLLAGEESVVDGVARLSEWRSDVHGIPPDVAAEEFTMELAHIEAPLERAQAAKLGQSALKLIELETAVEAKVATDVFLVTRLMAEYKRQTRTDLSDVEIAGMITAELAHWGVKRQNGSDYYTHPAAIAMILKSAIELRAKDIQADPERFQRLQFVAYTHDSFEDILRNNGTTYVNDRVIIPSMKFITTLFESLGRSDGDVAADMVFRISKMRQAGTKISQTTYVDSVLSDLDTMLVKLADNTHNDRLDPKGRTDIDPLRVRKNIERANEYDDFRAQILLRAGNATLQEQLVAHHIANVEVDQLRKYVKSRAPKRPKDCVYPQLIIAAGHSINPE